MPTLLVVYGVAVTMVALWLLGEVKELNGFVSGLRKMLEKSEERAKQWMSDSAKKDREIARLTSAARADDGDYKMLSEGVTRALETGSIEPLRRVRLQATRARAAGPGTVSPPVQGARPNPDDVPTEPGRRKRGLP